MAIKPCADVPASPPRPRTVERTLTESPPPRYLPSDVIFNILSRLPSKSVVPFRSVCKSWQAMLSEPDFIYAHLERSKELRPSLLMVPCAYDPRDPQKNKDDSAFQISFYRYLVGEAEELVHREELPRGIALWSSPLHCDGLILISTVRQELVVCNPATREFVTLPERKHDYMYTFPSVGFGFDPRSRKYKVARFYYEKLTNSKNKYKKVACKFEVLTLGTDTWRQTVDPPYWIRGRTPVHVQGYIYWRCAFNPDCLDAPDSFLRFSLTDEKFSLVPYPPSDLKPARFVELESELCCLCLGFTNQELEIWTLSFGAGQKPKWNRGWTTMVWPDLIIEPKGCWASKPHVVGFHEGAWLLTEEDNVYRYDARTSEIVKISSGVLGTRYHYPHSLHLTNYAESLVQIR